MSAIPTSGTTTKGKTVTVNILNTLENLVNKINESLTDIEGEPVASLLTGFQLIRQKIKENEFYKELVALNSQDVLVFKDDIENSQYVFLKVGDESNLQKIIKIKLELSLYEEGNPLKGGVIESATCKLIENGIKVAQIPLEQVIIVLKLNEINKKYKGLIEEINEIQETLNTKNEQKEKYIAQMNVLKSKLNINS